MIICGGCCQKIKRGLMADLIHMTAIEDLKIAGYGFETFVRKSKRDLERESKQLYEKKTGRCC
jgi:hypothetical protein